MMAEPASLLSGPAVWPGLGGDLDCLGVSPAGPLVLFSLSWINQLVFLTTGHERK